MLKLSHIFISALLVASCSVSYGALPILSDQAVQFFRFKESTFPSGQSSLSELRRGALQNDLSVSYQVEWNKQNFHLQGEDLWRDLQLSKTAFLQKNSKLYVTKAIDAKILRTLSATALVEVLDTDEFWAFVKTPEGIAAYTPLSSLRANYEDLGFYIPLIETGLRPRPDHSAPALTVIPPGVRLEAQGFKDGFVKLIHNGNVGYADINHLVSKSDFASWVFSTKTQWIPIRHRLNDYFITQDDKRVPLSDVKAMVTKPTLAIAKHSTPGGPLLRSHLQIKKAEMNLWTLSRLKGHGLVWWKKETLTESNKITNSKESLLTEDLLKKEIYSIAFESRNSLKGLVSSEGVFRSEDGKSWKSIPFFKEKNLPVAIHPEGAWFVGSYISFDRGTTFEPFIRWDKLAEALEKKSDYKGRHLKITQIDALKNNRVRVYVDNGGKKVSLDAEIGKWNWN